MLDGASCGRGNFQKKIIRNRFSHPPLSSAFCYNIHMFNGIEAPTFNKRDDENGNEKYYFAPRTLESVHISQNIDSQFDILFDKFPRTGPEADQENILSACGALVGRYILEESKDKYGEIDEVRGLAAFQGFFERELIKRGDGISHHFRNPVFFSAINREVPFAHAERMTEKVVGAQSTHSYIESLSRDENIVFVGSDTDFDVKHAIDLVVGKSNNPREEHPNIDEVVLVQVKTSLPSRDKIEQIKSKHFAYAKALYNFEGRAVGTSESERAFSHAEQMTDQESINKILELNSFYQSIVSLNNSLEPNWDSFVENAKKYNFDPILFYIRINLMDETRLNSIDKKFKKNLLYMAQEKVRFMKVPQEEFAKYNRAVRSSSHISTAKSVRSVIIAQGREVLNEVIL